MATERQDKNDRRYTVRALGIGCLLLLLPPHGLGDEKSAAGQGTRSLLDARRGFHTKLMPNKYKADGPAPSPSDPSFKLIHYPSPAGKLVAYLSQDPEDGKKHPALLWAHGGFGGIGKGDEKDCQAFREAGLIILCPSWRGENDNPGQFELFFGEVDDALAALEYLSKVEYVDPSRIYMAGHSSGGTITLLTAEATSKLRAAFSFGGAPDLEEVVLNGKGGYGNTPFDPLSKDECRLRSPTHFIASLRAPTFYFEGARSGYVLDAERMGRAAVEAKASLTVYIVKGGNHFNILPPLTAMVARKIQGDDREPCSLDITREEVLKAFAKRASSGGN